MMAMIAITTSSSTKVKARVCLRDSNDVCIPMMVTGYRKMASWAREAAMCLTLDDMPGRRTLQVGYRLIARQTGANGCSPLITYLYDW